MSASAANFPVCPYCGAVPHASLGQCPAIQSIEYYPDGTIKRVEKIKADQTVSVIDAFFGKRP